jgi:hypothetical protein
VVDVTLRGIALIASAFIALSFVLFAVEKTNDASKAQESAAIDPGGAAEAQRAHNHTAAREFVDDVNDVLLAPFAALAEHDNVWVRRGVPALLGLLFYGFALLFIARMLKLRTHGRRAPPSYT